MLIDEDIELVKYQVSMINIANYYGIKINRNGYISCPFHNENTASMKVYPGIKGYYCFGCGAGGNIFNFVMNYDGRSFEEAVRMVANAFNIPISDGENLSMDAKKRAVSQRIRALIKSEESKMESHQLSALSDTINLFEFVMRTVNPYGTIFCNIGNLLPILKGEWDERFRVYCDSR